ncbi:sulfite exporter TauE/SafE family protein [Paraconexibacter algicola]|uniref:Probable membrane transporter protein n=1 Tax=Paraconexibacter algicola TaxID=2133960 RepID=A0A2T4UGM3_9ACTN|nr:sulfite exporter TauE/SafE family protein [Paraconexibacter algicola]PTL58367.1 hypothetical protein C7Y72_01240 [Paraconexibacter algicola]
MTILEAIAILAAGLAAGTINAVIGSGTLVTFPVLLAVGYPPVVANTTNGLGLVPGSFTAAWGYRRELAENRRSALLLASCSAAGSVIGAILLLELPEDLFAVVVPVLIAGALVLVVFQPRVAAWVARRREGRAAGGHAEGTAGLRAGIGATGVYGGYFGAGQGILLFALLGTALPDDMARLQGLRNLLAGTANGVAALVFVLVADVSFGAAALIAVGAATGGVIGARIGRRLAPGTLRALVVVVGLAAILQLVL